MFCINLLFASVSFVQRNICHFGVVFYGDAAFRTSLTLCDFESLAGDYTFPITIPRGFSLFHIALIPYTAEFSFLLFFPQQIYTILNISYCLFLCCYRFLFLILPRVTGSCVHVLCGGVWDNKKNPSFCYVWLYYSGFKSNRALFIIFSLSRSENVFNGSVDRSEILGEEKKIKLSSCTKRAT